MFLANNSRDSFVAAPFLKSAVSPGPPIDMQTFRRGKNLDRTSLTLMNGLYCPPGSVAKRAGLAAAVMTCVMYVVCSRLGGVYGYCLKFLTLTSNSLKYD